MPKVGQIMPENEFCDLSFVSSRTFGDLYVGETSRFSLYPGDSQKIWKTCCENTVDHLKEHSNSKLGTLA